MTIYDAFDQGPFKDFIESPLAERDRLSGVCDGADATPRGSCCIVAYGVNECINDMTSGQCSALGGDFTLGGHCIGRFICGGSGSEEGACCWGCGGGNIFLHCTLASEADCLALAGDECAGTEGENPNFTVSKWWGTGRRCLTNMCLPESGVIRHSVGGPNSSDYVDVPFGLGYVCCVDLGPGVQQECQNYGWWGTVTEFTGLGAIVQVRTAEDWCESQLSGYAGVFVVGGMGKQCTLTDPPYNSAGQDYWFTCSEDITTPTACCGPTSCLDLVLPDMCRSWYWRSLTSTTCGADICPPRCCVSQNVCVEALSTSDCTAIGGTSGDQFSRCEE